AIFAWLRVVAIHEAYRLSAIEHRDARLERLGHDDADWQDLTVDPHSLEDKLLQRAVVEVLNAVYEQSGRRERLSSRLPRIPA
ncbi:MAG TPA: hypothetical protein VHL81_13175, partial [Gemmatimonadales bacterium]|nr:hypothetical protein [Gemmatimonadales bacterium]